jgi:putative ABC transport system permease protein
VFLSAEAAERHFGDEPAIGEVLTITFGDDVPRPYVVRGVAESFPANASFTFELLLNFAVGEAVGGDPSDSWRSNALATFIQLKEGSDLSAVKSSMEPYRAAQNAANDVWPVKSFHFTNLLEVSREAHLASVSISRGTDPANLFLFPLVAILLLALACFNYVNIALGQADRRLKEIGLRKAMGGRKGQLVVQFIGENFLLCLSALAVGIVLAQYLLLPGFNALFVDAEPLRLSLMSSPGVWLYLAAVLCITGLVAGAFPAFYLASLAPAAIFRDSNGGLGGRRWIGNGLLAVQFALAFITMAGGLVFLSNAEYQADRDWGYEKDDALVVQLARAGQFSILAADLSQHADITSIGGSLHHIMPRGSGPGGTLELPSGQVDARRYDVNHEYLETMGIRLRAGRFFDRNHATDATQAIIVNEEMARGLNLSAQELLGRQFPWTEEITYTVVGVVEDFHSDDFSTSIQASLFRIGAPDDFQHLVIQVNPGAILRVKEIVASSWARLFPGEVYTIFHQNEVFGGFFRYNRNLTMVFTFGALMALLISCMGLFGLASQNVARRTKEISIRMVLGATFPQVAGVINRSFLQLLIAAALISLPASYFLLESLLGSMYTYHITLQATPFLLSALIVFATASLTVLTQLRKLAVARPAVALRNA